MKRILLLSLAVSATLLATDLKNWEISPVAGMGFSDDNTKLDDQTLVGGELQYNGFDFFFAPELQVLQSLETDFDTYPGSANDAPPLENGSTFINRTAINAVHDFRTREAFRPFFKLGVGYESFHDYHYFENEDGVYSNAGIGAKYLFNDTFGLKVEGQWMHRFNKRDNGDFDNNYAVLGGLTIAFGQSVDADDEADAAAKRAAEEEAARKAAEEEAARKAAEDAAARKAAEENAAKAAAAAAAAAAALQNGDDDGDGVRNADDLCAHTLSGYKVDETGCAVPPQVNALKFALNSAKVSQTAKQELEDYAAFLKATGKRVRVVGHTDNSGPERFNKKLSLERAQAAADILINAGVPAQNIEIAGRGDAEPLMSNATAEGRAANRRAELHLIP